MFRAFKFVLKPTVGQAVRLDELLGVQCELYNAALEARRGAWRWEHRQVTRFEQFGHVAGLREARPDVLAFGVCVVRGTLTRVDLAFTAFFRRVRAGRNPGHPRFKSRSRFDSVSYPDSSGWKLDVDTRRLYLLGVGHVKVRLHRSLRGEPKTITVRRQGRRWVLVVFCAGIEPHRLAPAGRTVGIDLGVANLVATSDRQLIPNNAAINIHRAGLAQRQAHATREVTGQVA